jgi:glycerol kinase
VARRRRNARAAPEPIALQSAELAAAMQHDAARPLVELRVDGKATANDLLMQFQADLPASPTCGRVTETRAWRASWPGLVVNYWARRSSRRDRRATAGSSDVRDEAARSSYGRAVNALASWGRRRQATPRRLSQWGAIAIDAGVFLLMLVEHA